MSIWNWEDEMKDFVIKPEITVILSEDDIAVIMEKALAGAIDDWCYNVEPVGDLLDESPARHLAKGGMLKLYDLETGEKHWLDRVKFLSGVKLYYEVGFHVLVEDCRVYVNDLTDNDVDCIIQLAIFEEVLYEQD